MGVKLTELVQKKEISFDELAGKRIAIDFSNAAYQFLSSIRQPDGTPLMDSNGNITSHLMGIWTRFTNLISKKMELVIVLDGKAPALKIYEQEEREHRKRIAEEKLKEAQQEEDISLMYKYSKQTTRLSFNMIRESEELMKAMGLPVIQSPSESDAQGSYMCEKKDVWAFASSDYDALIHGCPRLLRNLTLSQRRKVSSGAYVDISPELIELKTVLKGLEINQDQLIALAILVGTDYNNKGVKGIGPKTALKLVKKYKTFDTLFKQLDTDFNWKKIYAIYKSMPIMKNYQIKFSKLDEEKVKKILVDKHEFSEERINKTLEKLNKEVKQKEQTGLKKWF